MTRTEIRRTLEAAVEACPFGPAPTTRQIDYLVDLYEGAFAKSKLAAGNAAFSLKNISEHGLTRQGASNAINNIKGW